MSYAYDEQNRLVQTWYGSEITTQYQYDKQGNSNIASPYDLIPNQNIHMGKNKFNKFIQNIKNNGIKETIKYVEYAGKKYVVDGHHRLKAAKTLGIESVPIEEVQLPYSGYETIQDLITRKIRWRYGNFGFI